MRLQIKHETHYAFAEAANHSIQYIRLTPRADLSQLVYGWELSTTGNLSRWADGFGNYCHVSIQDGAHDEVVVAVSGEVETSDTSGVLPADDRMSPLIFLRPTEYTACTPPIAAFAEPFRAQLAADGILHTMHELMKSIAQRVTYEPGYTNVGTTAGEVMEHGVGVCQDHAHLFIACCRHIGLPARYVSGYLCAEEGTKGHVASHAWAEVLVEDLGWVSFDPSNCQSATDAYVRLAVGFDYDSASPVRGMRRGGGSETLSVRVKVDKSERLDWTWAGQ